MEKIGPLKEIPVCPSCGSENLKLSTRDLNNHTLICNDCGHRRNFHKQLEEVIQELNTEYQKSNSSNCNSGILR